jgi:hypothetical protein
MGKQRTGGRREPHPCCTSDVESRDLGLPCLFLLPPKSSSQRRIPPTSTRYTQHRQAINPAHIKRHQLHRQHGLLLRPGNAASLRLHRIQKHHPLRAHCLRCLRHQQPRLCHLAQDLSRCASEAYIHSQPKPDSLHRRRWIRLRKIRLSECAQPHIPSGRES